MILIDANLLIYAWNPDAEQHDAARSWLDTRLSETSRVAIPWQSTLAFLRIATNPRIYPKPVTFATAWRQVESWLDCENVWIPEPGSGHRVILGELLRGLGGGPNLVPDVHLAALAIEHGLKLCSCDGDFARFKGLRWENPLAE